MLIKLTQKNLDCIYLQNAHSFQVIVTFYAIVIQFPPTHPLHPHSPAITRGYLTHSSATDCSHLSSSEAVCQRDRLQPPTRKSYVCVLCSGNSRSLLAAFIFKLPWCYGHQWMARCLHRLLKHPTLLTLCIYMVPTSIHFSRELGENSRSEP